MPHRKYIVTFAGGGTTTYETDDQLPRTGQLIRTPLGRMRVIEVSAPARFVVPGKLRAEPVASR
jgi:hypothetical protein